MKRRFLILCLAAVLLLCVGRAGAYEFTYGNQHGTMWSAWSGDYGSGLKPATGILYWWTVSGGGFEFYETPSLTEANRLMKADDSGVSVYRVFYAEDGITSGGAISGTGGTIAQGTIDNPVGVYYDPVTIAYTSGTCYVITGTSTGVVFEYPISGVTEKGETDKSPVGTSSVGVTVWVATPTAATHGRILGIRNTSGTTAGILYCGGLPIETTGVTVHQMGEDVGDITWVQQSYNTGISLYVLNEFKND